MPQWNGRILIVHYKKKINCRVKKKKIKLVQLRWNFASIFLDDSLFQNWLLV